MLSQLGLDQSLVFPIAVALIMIALIAAAILGYVQGWLVLRLWQTYQFHSINRILAATRSAMERGVDAAAIEDSPVAAVLRQSQRLGAFIRIVGSSIAAGLRFLAFGAVAIYTNPFLTVMLIVVTIPSAGLALLHFARRASRASRRTGTLSKDAGTELTALMQRALRGESAAIATGDSETTPALVEKARAMTNRILYAEQAKLVAGLVTMVSLGIFIGYMYVTTPESNANTMLVYSLALLLAFRQLIIVATSISNFGRFYPAVQAQQEMLDALEHASSSSDFRARLQRTSISKIVTDEDEEFDAGL